MSTPSQSEQLTLVAADPAQAGHPVVAGLVTAMEAELTALWEQVADLQRQLGRAQRQQRPAALAGRAGGSRSGSTSMRTTGRCGSARG